MRKRNILAIIPARKGSKRLKNKNELILDGKPLFLWTLELAIKSNLFNDIYVSTDSKKIFGISKKKIVYVQDSEKRTSQKIMLL